MPRVFSSKSWFSSRTGLQLSVRWSSGSMWLKVPSRAMVWRGPASNDQVTVSVPPSGWHDQQPPHELAERVGEEVEQLLQRRKAATATGGDVLDASADHPAARVAPGEKLDHEGGSRTERALSAFAGIGPHGGDPSPAAPPES
jgi:hypothetical protein